MNVLGRRLTWAQAALLGLALFITGIGLALGVGSFSARSYEQPSVFVLGSGNDLSVLITDGPARFLLASGNNATFLGDALSRVQPIGRSRIDVLLLAGSATDLTFLARSLQLANARHAEVIGPSDLPSALGLPADSILPTPRRFRLSNDTAVIVESIDPVEADDRPSFGWRMTIIHRSTRLVLLSDGEISSEFSLLEPISAVIIAGSDPRPVLKSIKAPVIVTHGDAATAADVRAAVGEAQEGTTWSVRVFDGEAKRFPFVDGGLRLPDEAVAIGGTPETS